MRVGTSPCPARLDITLAFSNTARPMAEARENVLMEKIVSLCKRRGFIFQSSEIYGGINGFWDYGPLGTELKRNLRDTWWRAMTREREDVVGLDATIIMHPAIWKASGHVDTFCDPMADCMVTQKRFSADHAEPESVNVYTFWGAPSKYGKQAVEPFGISETLPTLLREVEVDQDKYKQGFEVTHSAVKAKLSAEAYSAIENYIVPFSFPS